MVRRPRLDPEIFHLPVEKMREGYYSDKYFVRTRELLLKDDHRPCVTMQVFGKAHAFLGGIDEAIAILKLCSQTWEELEVWALYDGDEIAPWETVLLIEGPYDEQHGLPRCDLVAVVQRPHLELLPGLAAEFQYGDRLVDPAEERVRLAE